MSKDVLTVGRYTYFHCNSRKDSCPLDVHGILIRTSRTKTLLLYFNMIFILACSCLLLISKVQSNMYPLHAILVAGLSVVFLKFKEIRKEAVVIIPEFGIQLETFYRSGRIKRRFISIDKILKPVLNECVTPVTCYWNLALILRGEDMLVNVFQETQLPVRVMVPVWKALRNAIHCEEHKVAGSKDALFPSTRF